MDYKTEATPKAMAGSVPVFCAHDEIVAIEKLIPNPKNPNKHPKDQLTLLARIISAAGWRQPITVSKRSGFIVKGHGRLLAAIEAGFTSVPVDYQDYATEAEEYADLVADNRLAELSEIDNAMLADVFKDIDPAEIPAELTGYSEDEFNEILGGAIVEELGETSPEADVIPEEPKDPISKLGDVWILGRHRVMCADCTNEKNREILFDGAAPEILLTDPPYCSGGFQENGKSAGSIGTDAKTKWGKEGAKIKNDTLSTRGYQSLLKNAFAQIPCKVSYIFTDWRMWVYLYDIVESCEFNVRNMIIWDKKAIGMGQGWRTQHEIICFGSKIGVGGFDNTKGYGNILQCSRSGNGWHPTQKPVELLEMILDNSRWLNGVFDPFGGSGTTLIAAESYKQPAYLFELEPKFVDIIVERYLLTTGDKNIKLIRNGEEQPPEVYARFFEVDEDPNE